MDVKLVVDAGEVTADRLLAEKQCRGDLAVVFPAATRPATSRESSVRPAPSRGLSGRDAQHAATQSPQPRHRGVGSTGRPARRKHRLGSLELGQRILAPASRRHGPRPGAVPGLPARRKGVTASRPAEMAALISSRPSIQSVGVVRLSGSACAKRTAGKRRED
jgi:hypothetical protein